MLFHHDLIKKEQCISVCTKITPVLLLTLYLVRIHAAYLIVNLLLVLCERRFLQVLGEITQCRLAGTKCDIRVAIHGVIRDYLLRWSNVRALGCVLTIIEQLVPSLLFPLRELRVKRLFSSLLGNFDACDSVRQASELENSLLARD